MVHKQPPQSKSHAQNPSPRWHRLRAREGRAGDTGQDPRHLLLFMKPRQGPGAWCLGAEEWKAKGAGKDKDASRGSRPPLRAPGASTTPGNKRAKAVAGASPETFPAPKLARLSLDSQRHLRSSTAPALRVGAGAASRAPQPPPPRSAASAHSPASGRSSGRLSLRTGRNRPAASPLPSARSALAPPPRGGTRRRAGISERPP